jgi:hypothetical protein
LSKTLKGYLDKPVKGKGPLYSLILRLHPGGQNPYMELMKELPEDKADLIHPRNIVEVFRLIREWCPAERVLLATWDHGSGYSIFAVPPPPKKKAAQGVPIPGKQVVTLHPDHSAPMHRMFNRETLLEHAGKLRGVAKLGEFVQMLDDNIRWLSPPRGLTMDCLRSAIEQGFGRGGVSGRVDVIFMRNCFMHMFDTGFALQGVTDYLVACESLMYFAAYDYNIFLGELLASSNGITSEAVAAAAIKGFTGRTTSPAIRTDTAMFGNDLSLYPALNDCMNRMTRVLIAYARNPKHKKELLRLRRKLTDITHVDFPKGGVQLVDARMWFQKAGGLVAGNCEYWDALQEFLFLHKRTVGDRSYVGKMLGSGGYGESGFSLYFPTYQRNIEKYRSFYELYYALHTPFQSMFTRYSCWDEFIGFLFLGLPPH